MKRTLDSELADLRERLAEAERMRGAADESSRAYRNVAAGLKERLARIEALCDEKERVWGNHVSGSWLTTRDIRVALGVEVSA